MAGGGGVRNPLVCRKFRRLATEARDRELTPSEKAFLGHHAAACKDCEEFERQTSASLSAIALRKAARSLRGTLGRPCTR
ncbi:MAG TPA: hypothetical protein DER07_02515 [Armatimonadetes bacterium]|nr:hypothetical protein [Armatimonadota bacterium]